MNLLFPSELLTKSITVKHMHQLQICYSLGPSNNQLEVIQFSLWYYFADCFMLRPRFQFIRIQMTYKMLCDRELGQSLGNHFLLNLKQNKCVGHFKRNLEN